MTLLGASSKCFSATVFLAAHSFSLHRDRRLGSGTSLGPVSNISLHLLLANHPAPLEPLVGCILRSQGMILELLRSALLLLASPVSTRPVPRLSGILRSHHCWRPAGRGGWSQFLCSDHGPRTARRCRARSRSDILIAAICVPKTMPKT